MRARLADVRDWGRHLATTLLEAALSFLIGVSAGVLGRVEDWRHCSVGSAYPLLPVSVGSASLSEP